MDNRVLAEGGDVKPWIDANLDSAVKSLYTQGINLYGGSGGARLSNHFEAATSNFEFVVRDGKITLRKKPRFFDESGWSLSLRKIKSNLRCFHRDRAIMQRVSNLACVPDYFGSKEDGDNSYLEIEPIWGANLSYFRLHLGVDNWDYVALSVALAERLHQVHSEGVVLKDLKPDNIILRGPNNPVFVDFGIAIHPDVEDGVEDGFLMGTPCFMSPEQANKIVKDIDHRTDIYSLGGIMYFLFSGSPVFGYIRELDTLLYCCREEEPEPLHKMANNISDGLNDIVMKCLEKKPNDRYQTAWEVAFDLGMVGI